MSEHNKAEEPLIEEIQQLRLRVAELRAAEVSHRRVEKTLRDREQHLRTILTSVQAGIVVVDTETRKIVDANPAALHLIGLARDEVIDRVCHGFICPEDRGCCPVCDLNQTVENSERILLTENGENLSILKTVVPVMLDGRRVLIESFVDITDHIQAERELKQRTTQLQTAAEVSRAASSILHPDELIKLVVDLACERFNLYYVGLFLVDQTGEWSGEPDRWAVLRAGSGQAGQQMLAAGHKLEVGGESMIGWSVANQQARIALDVGKEAVRFENPFLPATRSEMALPLISRGQVIGAMTVQSEEEAAFSDEDIAVLQAMADQVANAIANARLFEQVQTHAEEQALLRRITETVSRSLAMQDLLETTLDTVLTAMGFEVGLVSLSDEETGRPYLAAHKGLPQTMARDFERNGFKGTLVDLVFQTGETIGIRDIRLGAPVDVTGLIKQGLLTYAGTPLVYGDNKLGTFCFFGRSVRELAARELSLLEAIGRQIGVGVENTRLFEETQQRMQELAVVFNASQTLAGAPLQAEEIAELVARQFVAVMGVTKASISLLDPEQGMMHVVKGLDVGEGRAPTQKSPNVFQLANHTAARRVIETSQPLVVRASDLDADPAELAYMLEYGAETLVIIPLAVKGQAIGVIELGAQDHDRHFTQEQLNLATMLANQAAVALENARLFQETQAALAEAEASHRSYLRREWQTYMQRQETLRRSGFIYDQAQVALEAELWRPEMDHALADGKLVTTKSDGRSDEAARTGLAAPIVLRGQTIGVLGLEDPEGTRRWSGEDRAVVEAISQQLAVALEGARLLEETQRRAARERVAREITEKMRRAPDMDALIQITVREAAAALGTLDAFLQLNVLPASGDENGNQAPPEEV